MKNKILAVTILTLLSQSPALSEEKSNELFKALFEKNNTSLDGDLDAPHESVDLNGYFTVHCKAHSRITGSEVINEYSMDNGSLLKTENRIIKEPAPELNLRYRPREFSGEANIQGEIYTVQPIANNRDRFSSSLRMEAAHSI